MLLNFFLISIIFFTNSCQNNSLKKNAGYQKLPHDHLIVSSDDEVSYDHKSYYQHRYYQPSYPIKLETYENTIPELQSFVAQHQYHSTYHPIIGIVTEDPMDILAANQLLGEIKERVRYKKQLRIMTDEILAKVVAYRKLPVGQEVPVPVVRKLGKTRLVMYRVDRVFDLGGGMPAFGLLPNEPKAASPILLFRGTDFSMRGLSSILADLDLNGPGLTAFHANRSSLSSWLRSIIPSYGKARVLGYSLGGSFAQYTCIYDCDLVSKDKNFPNVVFNQPGVDDDLALLWQKLPNNKKPVLRGYVTEGDMVSSVGKLIGNVKELTLDHLLEPLFAHVTLMSAQQRFYAYRLDVTLKHEQDYSSQSR